VAALVPGAPLLRVSAATGAGLLELRAAVRREAVGESGLALLAAHAPVVSSVRHRDALERARVALVEARSALADGLPADCLCTDLRACVQALGEITGESVTADVLEQIFSRFCIGK
jgi:tRNA modification GTPase